MLARRGTTLAELLVALALAALVLGGATRSVLTQQRSAGAIGALAAGDAQLRAARGAVGSDLRHAAASDLAVSESSDSAVQLRAMVASGIACDTGIGAATLAPPDTTTLATGGVVSAPRAGDSLWWRTDDSVGRWRASRVRAVSVVRVTCPGLAAAPEPAQGFALAPGDTVPAGAPLRVTRQIRYELYRAATGWQLGLREWSEALGAMSAPQPLAGPFERGATGPRTRFSYFDAAGGAGGPPGTARLRLISVVRSTAPLADGTYRVRTDTLDVALSRGGP